MPWNGEDRFFNTKHEGVNGSKAGSYADSTDAIALQHQLYIDFYHTPSHNSMAFKAFITDYSETYEVNYDTQDVYGRQDPFSSYIRTQRRISLAWDTVAASQKEAEENFRRCSELIQMMYPRYQKMGMADHYVVSEAPQFRVRFSNWMVDTAIKGSKDGPQAYDWADTSGLLCQIENLQFNPDLDAGSFDTKLGVFPKVIKLSCAIVPYTPSGPQWKRAGAKNVSHGQTKGGAFNHFPFGYDGYHGNKGEKRGPPPLGRGMAEEIDDDDHRDRTRHNQMTTPAGD